MENEHTLLIVDDEPFNLDILQEHLEDEGFSVVRAEDGPEALKILEANEVEFSAVLLDRMMPHMDGLEVLQIIKDSEIHKNLPVIIQTAAASDKDIMEGIEAGAFYYLTKPFEPELMLTIVRSAMSDLDNIKSSKNFQGIDDVMKPLLKSLHLEFKTIEDAQNVAGRISSLFPDPEKVLLGLTELVINAIEHGNLGITYEEKSVLLNDNSWKQEIGVRYNDEKYKDRVASLFFEKKSDEITLIIKDEGDGFDSTRFIDMSTDRVYDSHGRGIAMASMISFDSVDYNGKGNEVRCVVKY